MIFSINKTETYSRTYHVEADSTEEAIDLLNAAFEKELLEPLTVDNPPTEVDYVPSTLFSSNFHDLSVITKDMVYQQDEIEL